MTSGSRGVAPWRIVVPLAIAGGLALLPTPSGLAPHAWLYFALFTGVVAALSSGSCFTLTTSTITGYIQGDVK